MTISKTWTHTHELTIIFTRKWNIFDAMQIIQALIRPFSLTCQLKKKKKKKKLCTNKNVPFEAYKLKFMPWRSVHHCTFRAMEMGRGTNICIDKHDLFIYTHWKKTLALAHTPNNNNRKIRIYFIIHLNSQFGCGRHVRADWLWWLVTGFCERLSTFPTLMMFYGTSVCGMVFEQRVCVRLFVRCRCCFFSGWYFHYFFMLPFPSARHKPF